MKMEPLNLMKWIVLLIQNISGILRDNGTNVA
jgi:hypothetical protein